MQAPQPLHFEVQRCTQTTAELDQPSPTAVQKGFCPQGAPVTAEGLPWESQGDDSNTQLQAGGFQSS